MGVGGPFGQGLGLRSGGFKSLGFGGGGVRGLKGCALNPKP